ncbi:hypothetical protein GCM10023318_48240 [Nocardia callitridis]|uniref:MFS transporter n=1 Tax=Nocardia callitridis TaxID=648753 RepID=A0ABP9KPY0_9NOCA
MLSAGVTAVAHAAGGGSVPSEAAALLLLTVCSAMGFAVTAIPGRRFARTWLMVALATAQGLGHLMLSAADCHQHGVPTDGRMLGAHVLAVIVGACLIHRAERGVRWAVSTLRRVLPRLATLVVDRAKSVSAVAVLRVAPRPRLVDLSGWGRRGPPVFA